MYSYKQIKVLIKNVVQAIPTYVMSCFLLPTSVIRSLNSILLQLFQGSSEGSKKICWKSWKNLCKPKNKGRGGGGVGMRFRDFEGFNFVILTKQYWHIITSPSSLVEKFLQAKYILIMETSGLPRFTTYHIFFGPTFYRGETCSYQASESIQRMAYEQPSIQTNGSLL